MYKYLPDVHGIGGTAEAILKLGANLKYTGVRGGSGGSGARGGSRECWMGFVSAGGPWSMGGGGITHR